MKWEISLKHTCIEFLTRSRRFTKGFMSLVCLSEDSPWPNNSDGKRNWLQQTELIQAGLTNRYLQADVRVEVFITITQCNRVSMLPINDLPLSGCTPNDNKGCHYHDKTSRYQGNVQKSANVEWETDICNKHILNINEIWRTIVRTTQKKLVVQHVFGGYFLLIFAVSSTTQPLNQTTAIPNFII
jgi:hypothetical protein